MAADVEQAYARRAEAPGLASEFPGDDVDPNLQAGVLTTLIRTEILRKAAEDRDVDVSDDEIAEQREVLVETAGGQEALDELLADSNVSDEELETNLVDQAIQAEIGEQLAPEVSDDDVRTEFEEDPQGQYGDKVDVRHILTETEDDAEDAKQRIESGEEFAEVAQDMSQDTGSAANGGQLGPVAKGSTVEAFDEAAFNADVGDLVGPVETEFGFHVLEVTDQVAGAEFAEVEDEIRTQLEATTRSQAFSDYIADFVSDLEVDVDSAYGTWDAQSVSVVPPQASESPTDTPAATDPAELPTDLELELPTDPAELPTALPTE
jgi:parvulin-like peptidyl-prolyl isomerase